MKEDIESLFHASNKLQRENKKEYDAIFKKVLKEFFKDASIMRYYAIFLDRIKELDRAEDIYLNALEISKNILIKILMN